MDIVEFFQISSGKWFSQQTSHHLATKQSEVGKSDLQIEWLDKTDPDVVHLSHRSNLDSSQALCGVRVSWSGRDGKGENSTGSTLLVPIADPDTPNQGILLRQVVHVDQPPLAGRYVLGSDEALTLITEYETLYSEERLWFASPNLRFRTSILKQQDGFCSASFFSEIRMGGAKPA
jgi:hypothetical protein